MNKFIEVRNHHVNDENQTCIDIYFGKNQMSEGRTIATIDNKTLETKIQDASLLKYRKVCNAITDAYKMLHDKLYMIDPSGF